VPLYPLRHIAPAVSLHQFYVHIHLHFKTRISTAGSHEFEVQVNDPEKKIGIQGKFGNFKDEVNELHCRHSCPDFGGLEVEDVDLRKSDIARDHNPNFMPTCKQRVYCNGHCDLFDSKCHTDVGSGVEVLFRGQGESPIWGTAKSECGANVP
jgi:hypothetical protein